MRILKARLLTLILVSASMFVIAACGGDTAASEGGNAEAIAAGQQIYETGGVTQLPCMTCHTLDGSALVGPSFQGLGERAGSRVEGLSAEEYLRQSIKEPQAYMVPDYQTAMPTVYSEMLSEDDIENLIVFLLNQ